MYTETVKQGQPPKDFETFNSFIDTAPKHPFEIFNIPSHVMFKAGYEAGFNHIEFKRQYPDPAFKDNKAIKSYMETCNPTDYVMKLKKISL